MEVCFCFPLLHILRVFLGAKRARSGCAYKVAATPAGFGPVLQKAWTRTSRRCRDGRGGGVFAVGTPRRRRRRCRQPPYRPRCRHLVIAAAAADSVGTEQTRGNIPRSSPSPSGSPCRRRRPSTGLRRSRARRYRGYPTLPTDRRRLASRPRHRLTTSDAAVGARCPCLVGHPPCRRRRRRRSKPQ